MKHKVKVLWAEDGRVSLRIDGIGYSYLIQRSAPLSLMDMITLCGVMDTRMIESLLQASGLVMPRRGVRALLAKLFSGVWKRRDSVSLFNFDAVADYIEKVGVEVDIDEKTKGVVLLKSDIGKIRKGGVE